MKNAAGYFLAFLPVLGSLAVVVAYWLFIPSAATPPNNTLWGTEIFIPVLFGVFFAAACVVRMAFKTRAPERRTLAIWAGVAISPMAILLFYLWILAPLSRP